MEIQSLQPTMAEHSRTDLVQIDPVLIADMRSQLRSQSKECVMETLGISSNTWLKIKRGMPIRRSIAERLIERFDTNRHQ